MESSGQDDTPKRQNVDGDSSTSLATGRTEAATTRVPAKAEAITGMFQIRCLFLVSYPQFSESVSLVVNVNQATA